MATAATVATVAMVTVATAAWMFDGGDSHGGNVRRGNLLYENAINDSIINGKPTPKLTAYTQLRPNKTLVKPLADSC